jgi:hypothetical protein
MLGPSSFRLSALSACLPLPLSLSAPLPASLSLPLLHARKFMFLSSMTSILLPLIDSLSLTSQEQRAESRGKVDRRSSPSLYLCLSLGSSLRISLPRYGSRAIGGLALITNLIFTITLASLCLPVEWTGGGSWTMDRTS